MFWQAFHNIMVSPSRCCQEWSLSFSVFNVHVTTCFTKCFGNRVVAMPRSTVQWGFFFLATQNKNNPQWKKNQNNNNQKQMLQEAIHLLSLEGKQDGRKKKKKKRQCTIQALLKGDNFKCWRSEVVPADALRDYNEALDLHHHLDSGGLFLTRRLSVDNTLNVSNTSPNISMPLRLTVLVLLLDKWFSFINTFSIHILHAKGLK